MFAHNHTLLACFIPPSILSFPDHRTFNSKETMKVYFSFLVCCFVVANLTAFVISFTTIPRRVKRDAAARTPAAGRDVRIANNNIIQSNNNGNKAVTYTTTTTATTTTISSSTITSSIAEARIETEQEEEAASLTSVQQSTFSFPIQVKFSSPPTLGTVTNANTAKTSQDLMQESRNIILSWYDEFIESTSFFQRDPKDALKFTIPLFHTATVTLSEQEGEKKVQKDKEIGESEQPINCLFFKIHVDGATEKDYAMLCAKIYESQQEYNCKLLTSSSSSSCAEKGEGGCFVIENACLKDIVQKYFRQVKPHPGYDAKDFSFDDDDDDDSTIRIKDILNPALLEELLSRGFVTVDTNITTTASEIAALSNVLTSKTVQERTVRSDTVAFIDSDMARKCGIQKQFGILMEVANYLNQNLHWDSMRSGYKPIFPATEQCPLTNPANIQIASYGHGEFYVPHSDNLLVMGQNHETGASLVRSNYRQFTCILYCNDDWDMKVHGGALRIYPGTIDVTDPMSVKAHNVPYTDVNPTNGKLLIFDSRLVHSVEKVLDPYKKRLAMTIWINRPEDNGVSVNVWNENEERVEWYRLF